MARGRKKKNVLNQMVEENMGVTEDGTAIHPDNFPKEGIIGWVNPELKQDTKKIIKELEKNHNVDGQEEIERLIEGVFNTELQKEIDKTVEEKAKVVEDKGIVGRPEQNEISLKNSSEKLSEVLEKRNEAVVEPNEKVVEEVDETPRPVGVGGLSKEVRNSLSNKELRFFQRTGKLPK